MQDDDFSLFKAELRGVKPLTQDRADTGKSRPDVKRLATLRQAAATRVESIKVDGLSDQFVIDVGAEDPLHWAANGVQEGQMRKLKLGQIAFDGSLDLHGMSVEKARDTLWEFLAEANKFEVRCVRVTHGKAARKDGRKPLIKSHVNTWLRQHPQVLGFTSCLPKHGGTGAVYVMLKRTMMDGRDE
ncbi:Smr domain protein [Pseudomonas marincola]|jgi:DNA-nicking Smr family endonuclease|uniref:DNA mismatch repair protein MutS n=1 Tax=Pseudomonas marincola TaxID=437900 RepID=A0A1I6XEP9_9PSED|nr:MULTISPECIES: Smr/MutS family protein [Pseudomonas]MAB98214.1 DNA mismatch repair protein MutS [Pseudomonadaceae bacterium]NRH29146.1 DNA mismatch repair protein MutS [Pseudomonas sp. MS19]OEO26211.1 DNA mismatch repair protein MutS [Pseudomonas sp. J237]CAE6924669.1 Smr domain protein [Pseudomonas marincola]SFT36838.1 DNA-nicking endonuclease, Smr domain [Pseudomonas marincola]